MSINPSNKNPNKPRYSLFSKFPVPTIENDFKLQAILVYALDRLEDTVKYIENGGKSEFFNKEESTLISEFIINFRTQIEEYVPSFNDIYKQLQILQNQRTQTVLTTKTYNEYRKFIFYYNSLVQACEKHLTKKTKWIPDLVGISLLNYWIVDLGKNTVKYSFLYKMDLQSKLDVYNKVALRKKGDKAYGCIDKMYNITSDILMELNQKSMKK